MFINPFDKNKFKYKYHRYINKAPIKPNECRCRVEQTTPNKSLYPTQKVICGNEVVTIIPKTYKSFENNEHSYIWVCDNCYKRIMNELNIESEKKKRMNDLNKIPRL